MPSLRLIRRQAGEAEQRAARLERGIGSMAGLTAKGGMWIAWPKKTSASASDLTQPAVLEAGLASGLVDYEVCALDADRSGLKFARSK